MKQAVRRSAGRVASRLVGVSLTEFFVSRRRWFVLGGLILLSLVWGAWPSLVADPALGTMLGAAMAVAGAIGLFASIVLHERELLTSSWLCVGDPRRAARNAGLAGYGIAAILIGLGAMSLLVGNLVGALWWIALACLLLGGASKLPNQAPARRVLAQPVDRFLDLSPDVVSADLTIQQLVDEYFSRRHHKIYPVEKDGRLRGCVSAQRVRDVPREEWRKRRVDEVAEECSDENTIRADAGATQALTRLHRANGSWLMVVEDGELVGILSML